MLINTRENYIEIGYGTDGAGNLLNVLRIPAPSSLTTAPQTLADAGRNADGTMLVQQIGRNMITLKLSWARLKAEDYWRINRWFDQHGMVCHVKYFDQNTGIVKIHRFYRGLPSEVSPAESQKIVHGYSVPTHYHNYSLSLIDMGEDDVYIVDEMEV